MKIWLEKNKIYIEVFSFVILGLASIIVAGLSWKTSEKELEILRLEHQPIINIKRNYAGELESILIENVGYHLFDQKVNIQSFYEISPESYAQSKYSIKYLCIMDLYKLVYETDNTVGRIASIYSSDNSYKEKKRITSEFYSHPDYLDFKLNLKSIVKIDYRDELKENKSCFYLIDIYDCIEISEAKFNELNKVLRNSQKSIRRKNISEISATELIEMMLN